MSTSPNEHDPARPVEETQHVVPPSKRVYVDFPDNWQAMTEAEKDTWVDRAATLLEQAVAEIRTPSKKVFSSVPKEFWDMTPEEKEAWGLHTAAMLQQKLGPNREVGK
jgi:hypothetical protein